MAWQHILYSVESGVAHVVLNRPEKLNALGMGPGPNRVELVEALEQAPHGTRWRPSSTTPTLRATGFFEESDHPTESRLLMARGPRNWSQTPPQIRRPPPGLGENTPEVLAKIGYSEEDARTSAATH